MSDGTPGQADEPLFTAWRAVADEIEEGPFGGDQYNAGHVWGLRWCADQIEAAIAVQQPQAVSDQTAAEIREALARAERGEVVDLGSFAQYADEPQFVVRFCDERGRELAETRMLTGTGRKIAIPLDAEHMHVDAAQQPAPGIPLRSDAETCAMLRADLADSEALLARWPKCPGGCKCRIGIEEDADRNECGCDGPCTGDGNSGPTSQLHEGDWDDVVSEATS